MFYIIYKTINTVNNKFYIGKHKTNMLEFDGYLGSGKILKQAIKKYGKEKFIRETLYVFGTNKEASLKEAEILTRKFLIENADKSYNLHVGGVGGAGYIVIDENGEPKFEEKFISEEKRKEMSEKFKNTAIYSYSNGEKKRLNKNHPDVISGMATIPKTNSSVFIVNGIKTKLALDDPRIETGEAIHLFKGVKLGSGGFKKGNSLFLAEDGNSIIQLTNEEAEIRNLKNMNYKTSIYKYPDGSIKRLSIDHPDVLSKVAVGINSNRKMKTTICPFCNKTGAISNMRRYHFNNCKKITNLPKK